MKVFMFIVNYEADTHLINLMRSVRLAIDYAGGIELNLHIYDNSQKTKTQEKAFRKEISVIIDQYSYHSDGNNIGYFGCLPVAQSLIPKNADVCIFCNPDLVVDVSFFKSLKNSTKKSTGMLAPSIIDKSRHIDLNPKYINRLGLQKMKRLKFIYSSIITFTLFNCLAIMVEIFRAILSAKSHGQEQSMNIYAPHGAMFIFFDILFFKTLPKYPCFLFGEEIFIGEEANCNSVDIFYDPEVRVVDNRHASIKKLDRSIVRKFYYESIDFLIERYYT